MSFLKYNILISPRYKVRRGLIFCSQSFYWQLTVKQTRVPISGIKENLPTEGVDTQSQARAREIVESKEYDEFFSVNMSFLDRIHDKKMFLEEGLVNDNGKFNEEILNERLSGTSFESVDEFFSGIRKCIEYFFGIWS